MFNIQFEELHQKQSQWTVPDTELRESLRLAVAEVLLPAYRSFVKRFGCVIFSIHQMFCLFSHYLQTLEHFHMHPSYMPNFKPRRDLVDLSLTLL